MRILFANILLFMVMFFSPAKAHALDTGFDNLNLPMVQGKSVMDFCSNVIKKNSIAGNIIRCVDKIVKRAGDKLMLRYTLLFANIIFYMVIIAIMFHGIKMMYGVANIQGMTFILIAKIIVVMYFCTPQGVWQIRQWRDAIIDFPKTISVQIAAAAGNNGPIPSVTSLIVDFEVQVSAALGTNLLNEKFLYPAIYDKFDEQIMKLLGMKCDDKDGKSEECKSGGFMTGVLGAGAGEDRDKKMGGLFVGIAALVVGLLATGPIGVKITMVAVIYATAIIMAVAELVLFFILIAVAMNFLAAIAPLAIACILFDRTKGMFKTWLSYVLSYLVQPIFLVTFMTIMLSVLMPISKDMQKFFQKVMNKWENAAADPKMETQIFNCFGNSYVQKSDVAKAMLQKRSSNSYASSGYGDVDRTDTDEKCSLYLKKFSIDEDEKNSLLPNTDENKLTFRDIDGAASKNMAVIILMIMFVSFMKHLPQIMDRIIGQTSASLSMIAQKPSSVIIGQTDKLLTKVSGFIKR